MSVSNDRTSHRIQAMFSNQETSAAPGPAPGCKFADMEMRTHVLQPKLNGQDQLAKPTGRSERIRTSGPCVPNTVLYQAELRSVRSGCRPAAAAAARERPYSPRHGPGQAAIGPGSRRRNEAAFHLPGRVARLAPTLARPALSGAMRLLHTAD